MIIVDRIKKLRTSKGISKEQLADEMGITVQTIEEWENGKSTPQIEKIIKLSDYFDVTTDYLLKGAESINNTKIMSEKVLRIIATCINYIGFIITLRYLYFSFPSSQVVYMTDRGFIKDLGIICLVIGTTLFIISIQKDRKKEYIRKFLMVNIWAYAVIVSLIVDFIFSSYWVQISYIFVAVLTEIILLIKQRKE